MGRAEALVAALLVLPAFAGCFGDDEDEEETADATTTTTTTTRPTGGPPGDFVRTEDRAKPVLLVHGFSFSSGDAQSDPAAWTPMIEAFSAWGWNRTELMTVGYYGCDAGFALQASDFGSHDSHMTAAGHVDHACGPASHNRNTTIEHLAYHWAWLVHDEFTVAGRCVDVVAHSMGGLIVRYALAQTAASQIEFPPVLCVEDVVTLGAPFAGAEPVAMCGVFEDFGECLEMTPGSPFLRWLDENAQAAQVAPGTDWSLAGSSDDSVVSGDSAIAMEAPHKVKYLRASDVHHSVAGFGTSYLAGTAEASTAAVVWRDDDANWTFSERAPWPARWADHSLVHGSTTWAPSAPNTGPDIEEVSPAPGAHQLVPQQAFSVELECADDPEGHAEFVDFLSGDDVVESAEDLLGSSPSHTFRFGTAGTYVAKAWCRDEAFASGADAEATWTLTVQES